MTLPPESSFPSPSTLNAVPWWWQLLDAAGGVVEPRDGRQEFPNQADAESWVGECWTDLAEEGVTAVTLFEGDREVYGPMSLETP